MPTQTQIDSLHNKLKVYKARYLKKQYEQLDESGTRLMINSFLTEVLGYTELEDIKTEYRIRGEYADYVIQVARKKHFVVEVKSVQLDLNQKHLRQSTNYAANEGIDWILLVNGKTIELYRVLFTKPIDSIQLFSIDLSDPIQFKKAAGMLVHLTKRSVLKKELELFWKRHQAIEFRELSKLFYAPEVVRFLRRNIKSKTGIFFSESELIEAVHNIITHSIESSKPKQPREPNKINRV